jgi:nitroimidazol reductase NimA-like FMN-containing flavoprotein (pyridoxamine 5'-phosphate oxidase superfamily)
MKPATEKNIAGYGLPTLAWDRALERLEQEWKAQPDGSGHTHWLATVRPDGKPHVVPVGAAWVDDTFYFTSGPGTRKSMNLAQNPHCVITLAASGLDLVVEGEVAKVKDDKKLHRLAEVFALVGWAPTVRDGAFYHDYSAPSAGPPPWELYELTPTKVFGLATAEPHGATRWTF